MVPEFDENYIANPEVLAIGNMVDGLTSLKINPKSEWTFTLLTDMFADLQREFPSIISYALFGHSAGAKFVHRMILFGDTRQMTAAVAANAGWYTTLDRGVDLPLGVRNMLVDEEIRCALARPLIIMAGEDDIVRDKYLRTTPGVMRQGRNRYERARHMFNTALDMASLCGEKLAWQFVTVPNLGHSASGAAKSAVPYLLIHAERT